MIFHLLDKHQISKTPANGDPSGTATVGTSSSISNLQQPTISQMVLKPKPAVVSRNDNAVALFIVLSQLPHAIAESASFKSFVHTFAPGYIPKSARTVKRHILEMYTVCRSLLKSYLTKLEARVSLTFDGWSNESLKEFYSVTMHFTDPVTCSTEPILFDFFSVVPGVGVGARIAERIYLRLKSFDSCDKLLTVVSDHGADAVKAASCFSTTIFDGSFSPVLNLDHHLR